MNYLCDLCVLCGEFFYFFPRQALTQRPQMFWLIPATFTSALIWW
jgi:hypothetical protein